MKLLHIILKLMKINFLLINFLELIYFVLGIFFYAMQCHFNNTIFNLEGD